MLAPRKAVSTALGLPKVPRQACMGQGAMYGIAKSGLHKGAVTPSSFHTCFGTESDVCWVSPGCHESSVAFCTLAQQFKQATHYAQYPMPWQKPGDAGASVCAGREGGAGGARRCSLQPQQHFCHCATEGHVGWKGTKHAHP